MLLAPTNNDGAIKKSSLQKKARQAGWEPDRRPSFKIHVELVNRISGNGSTTQVGKHRRQKKSHKGENK